MHYYEPSAARVSRWFYVLVSKEAPRSARAVKQDEAEQLRLQKTHDRELKTAARIYKKQQAEAAKVARQQAAEERRKAKKARADELAAARALEKQQREAVTSQKSQDTANKAKRKVSHSAAKNSTKRRRVLGAASQAEAAPELPSPLPRVSKRGRQIKPTEKSESIESFAYIYRTIHQEISP